MISKEAKVYEIIESKAKSNSGIQAITGVLGFPWTLIADVGVLFTHYGPMLNEIREIYGRDLLTKEALVPVLKGCGDEILSDMVIDKIIGQVPVIGVAANMICAKAMTWRIGILFGMLSARGEEISAESVTNCVKLIRVLFPQTDSLKLKKPKITVVEKLFNTLSDESIEDFDDKVISILDALK